MLVISNGSNNDSGINNGGSIIDGDNGNVEGHYSLVSGPEFNQLIPDITTNIKFTTLILMHLM